MKMRFNRYLVSLVVLAFFCMESVPLRAGFFDSLKSAASSAAETAKQKLQELQVMLAKVGESFKQMPGRMKDKVQALSFNDAVLDLTFPVVIPGTPARPAVAGTPAQPAVGGTLAQPAVGGALAKPAIGGMFAKPAIGGMFAKPAVAGTLAKPSVADMLAKPAVAGTPAVPATPDKTIIVGIKFPVGAGYGDPATGFSEVKGSFFPTTMGPIPMSPATLMEKIPGLSGVLRDVQTLKPQTVFLIKLIALLNDAKKMPPLDAVGFVLVNSNFLLARLAKTPGMEGKGLSALLDVLPGPLKDMVNQLKLPVTDQDLQEYKDRNGKPASEMQKNVSLVRFEMGFKTRAGIIKDNVLPLVTADLNLSDKALFVYALQHQTYDLDQGFLPEDKENRAAQVKEFITKRATKLLAISQDALARMTASNFTADQIAEVNRLIGIITQTAEQGTKVAMRRPEFTRAGEPGKKVDVPLSQFFDVKWYQVNSDILNRTFGVDGYVHENTGPYLFDDSFLSKDEAIKDILAVFFRCIKEKNNPNFSVASFMQEELGSLYNRVDEKYRGQIDELARPFMTLLKQVKGLAGLESKPVSSMLSEEADEDVQAGEDAGLDQEEFDALVAAA